MFSDEISVITLFKCFIALKTIKISEILQAQNSTHTLAMPVNIHTDGYCNISHMYFYRFQIDINFDKAKKLERFLHL